MLLFLIFPYQSLETGKIVQIWNNSALSVCFHFFTLQSAYAMCFFNYFFLLSLRFHRFSADISPIRQRKKTSFSPPSPVPAFRLKNSKMSPKISHVCPAQSTPRRAGNLWVPSPFLLTPHPSWWVPGSPPPPISRISYIFLKLEKSPNLSFLVPTRLDFGNRLLQYISWPVRATNL
jgi:hypothetical protein